ncbi:MAG TPA: hypothetical protein DCL21_01345 [Alphaproteobacteria bacterium]|nr:hypothetical protein [Alphaproteobacteria bacterium]
MPIMNGIEAAKKIKLHNKDIPVVAMTANIAESIKQECELAGMNDYLTKPITEATLIKLLDKYSR